MGLLSEIEFAATDSSVPVVDLLRKCKILASRLKHAEFSTWINSELNGYSDITLVPEYRQIKFSSPIGDFSGPFGSGIKNAPIPVSAIPKKIRDLVTSTKMPQPIAEIEELSKSKGSLTHTWTGDMIAFMQEVQIYQHMSLVHAHNSVSPAMLKGIVDTVRTRLLDYVLAIQTESPNIDNVKPSDPAPISATVLHQTFNTTILGGQANLGGQATQATSGNSFINVDNSVNKVLSDVKVIELLQQLKDASLSIPDEDNEEATDALTRIETQLQKTKPDVEKIKNYLDIVGHVVNLAPVANQLYQYIVQLLK